MVNKKDWRVFLIKLNKIVKKTNRLYQAKVMIKGEELLLIDLERERILCRIGSEKDSYREYKHPDSFKSGISFAEIKNSIRTEAVLDFDDMSKL